MINEMIIAKKALYISMIYYLLFGSDFVIHQAEVLRLKSSYQTPRPLDRTRLEKADDTVEPAIGL